MTMKRFNRTAVSTFIVTLSIATGAFAQVGVFTKEDLVRYTPEWKGERFEDGRPKVSDGIIERMKAVTLEEAWATLRSEGFTHQYEEGWLSIHPENVLVGRALTALWMPGRPDVHEVIAEEGAKNGRIGGMNAWPVDLLKQGDVYVADHFGLHVDGASIGDNVGNAIYANSGNGIVYDGSIRDIEGLEELENFTSFVRSYHPSHHFSSLGRGLNSTMMGINSPIRIGAAMVMPGDVVLGRSGGVIFIPAHLAEEVVTRSELTRLRDMFGHLRLREGTYTPGQIDTRWTEAIEDDFWQWLADNAADVPVPVDAVREMIGNRPE
jgi:regulator of RNase E activity RraA